MNGIGSGIAAFGLFMAMTFLTVTSDMRWQHWVVMGIMLVAYLFTLAAVNATPTSKRATREDVRQ